MSCKKTNEPGREKNNTSGSDQIRPDPTQNSNKFKDG